MNEHSPGVRELYLRWLKNELSEEETGRFFQLIGDAEPAPDFLKEGWDQLAPGKTYSEGEKKEMAAKITGRPEQKAKLLFLSSRWFRYAAAVLLVVATASYLWKKTDNAVDRKPGSGLIAGKDVLPASNKAILVLGDESVIQLDTAADGQLSSQGGSLVLKTADGELLYTSSSRKEETNVFYQKLITPRGGQYQVTLADGTQVWLNAASSIRFPSVFTGSTREVDITGEVYFDVAPNAKTPFRVNVDQQTRVEVLGTEFNIKAYREEPSVIATLIQGSVRIDNNKESELLSPGMQAAIRNGIKIDKGADIEQATAWKNGLFNFNGSDVKEVMREIGRWYDLDIIYSSDPGQRRIRGKMQRNLTLYQVMNVLAGLDIHCRMEGRKLVLTD